LENDEEEEARYHAQLYGQHDDADEMLTGGSAGRRTDSERRNEDNGYYDDLDLDIDESLLEGLVIVALAATLLILVYVRQQRNRQRENANNAAAAGAGGQGPGPVNNNNNDRGLFPQPGQPEFGQWVAGGVGH
jgi:SEL1 protein